MSLLHELGIETGIDLEKLRAVASRLEQVLGRPLPGQVMRAGPRLRQYAREEQAQPLVEATRGHGLSLLLRLPSIKNR